MDIKEYTAGVRNAKAEVEDAILELLRDFQNDTGLAIIDVHIRTTRELGDGLVIVDAGVEVFI